MKHKYCKDFFYYLHLLLCFISNTDVNRMICNPFEYAEFCTWKCLGKYLAFGVVFCILLASESIILTIFLSGSYLRNYYFFLRDYDLYVKVRFGVNIFFLVTIVVIKVVYSYVVIQMAKKTKKSLRESEELASQNAGNAERKRKMHRRIYHFSLIPLVLSILCSFHDIFERFLPIVEYQGKFRGCFQVFIKKEIVVCFSAGIFSVSSCSYIVGLFIFFPKIRNSIQCKTK